MTEGRDTLAEIHADKHEDLNKTVEEMSRVRALYVADPKNLDGALHSWLKVVDSHLLAVTAKQSKDAAFSVLQATYEKNNIDHFLAFPKTVPIAVVSSTVPDIHVAASEVKKNEADDILHAIASHEIKSDSKDAKSATEAALFAPFSMMCGVSLSLICRLIVDSIVQCSWNRDAIASPSLATNGGVKLLSSAMSFSGFESYVRRRHIKNIERKLMYMLQQEIEASSPGQYTLVHVYVNNATNEAIVLMHEPLSGEVLKLSINEDLGSLPVRQEKLYDINLKRQSQVINKMWYGNNGKLLEWEDAAKLISYNSPKFLYNPWEFPAEEAALSDMVARLRLVRGSSGSIFGAKLMLVEDPRFVVQLKKLLDTSATLPFFYICNETNLYFEVDGDLLAKEGSIKRLVFGSIRKQKNLHSFLVSVISNIKIVLSSYNSSVMVSMTWTEMLAHLTDHCNPFISIELKPRFLEPHQYVYRPENDHAVVAFTGDEDNDPLEVQRGEVDMDGGSFPNFDSTFKISFRPPKLTSCKLLSTEIHRMKVENQSKYVIVMAREAKRVTPEGEKFCPLMPESFKFLTIYDPRTATDYQCGVKPGCKLYDDLKEPDIASITPPPAPKLIGKSASSIAPPLPPLTTLPTPISIADFMTHVAEACDTDMLILGPSITPRLVLTAYNKRGKEEQAIGSSEMSISAVLSGSGVSKEKWVILTHNMAIGEADAAIDESKKSVVKAGEICVELSFRKLAEIEAEKQSLADRQKRLEDKANGVASRKPSVVNALLGSGAGVSGGGDAAAETERLRSQLKCDAKKAELQKKETEAMQAQLEQLVRENSKLEAAAKKNFSTLSATDTASSGVGVVTPEIQAALKELDDLRLFRKEKEKETVAPAVVVDPIHALSDASTADEIAKVVLQVFISRFQKTKPSSSSVLARGPLDPLLRGLKSIVAEGGGDAVSASQLQLALSDLLVDLADQRLDTLFRDMTGVPAVARSAAKALAPVAAATSVSLPKAIAYLNTKYASLFPKLAAITLGLSSSTASTAVPSASAASTVIKSKEKESDVEKEKEKERKKERSAPTVSAPDPSPAAFATVNPSSAIVTHDSSNAAAVVAARGKSSPIVLTPTPTPTPPSAHAPTPSSSSQGHGSGAHARGGSGSKRAAHAKALQEKDKEAGGAAHTEEGEGVAVDVKVPSGAKPSSKTSASAATAPLAAGGGLAGAAGAMDEDAPPLPAKHKSLPSVKKTDWNTAPLPEGWERRTDPSTHKVTALFPHFHPLRLILFYCFIIYYYFYSVTMWTTQVNRRNGSTPSMCPPRLTRQISPAVNRQ